jgi:hypothetical protein
MDKQINKKRKSDVSSILLPILRQCSKEERGDITKKVTIMYQRIFKDPGSEGSMSSSLTDAKKTARVYSQRQRGDICNPTTRVIIIRHTYKTSPYKTSPRQNVS